MPADITELTKRAHAILAERLARFELLLDAHAHLLDKNERDLADSIRADLSDTRGELLLRLRNLAGADAEQCFRLFTEELNGIDLQPIHDRLRHLDIPRLLRESTTFLDAGWSHFTASTSLKYPPSLCLAADPEPSRLEYQPTSEDASGRVNVIQLPKLDYGTPLAWPLLFHEIGHVAMSVANILPNENDRQVNWLLEFACDYLALKVGGPAYLLPFLDRAILTPSYLRPTIKHPAARHRVDAMLEQSKRLFGETDTLALATELAQVRTMVAERYEGQIPDELPIVCESCSEATTSISRAEAEQHPKGLNDLYAKLDNLLIVQPLPSSAPTPTTIADSLAQGILGASHRPDHSARAKVEALREAIGCGATADSVKALLKAAKAAVCDEPNDCVAIVTAAWIHYLHESSTRFETLIKLATPEGADLNKAWDSFRNEVGKWDILILASVDTAAFHEQIKGLRATDAQ